MKLNRKQTKLIEAIFAVPTRANIKFADIEKLVAALDGDIVEGSGSRISFELAGRKIFLHRPHPGKEAMKYQVEGVREFLEAAGVKNE